MVSNIFWMKCAKRGVIIEMFALEDVLRSCISALAVFVMTVVCGRFLLPRIRERSHGQQVRDEGPKTHLEKSGTPTFGGLFFLIPLVLFAIVMLFVLDEARDVCVIVLFMVLFGSVGFVDDYIKVHISKEGLSVRQKTVFLAAVSIAASVYTVWFSDSGSLFLLPFATRIIPITGTWKILYTVFITLFIFYISNSVNITDGLDGLLSSLMAVAMIGLFFSFGLLTDVLKGAPGLMTLSLAIFGGVLGFLIFNRYPAQVFMGDTGSLALGAGFALMTCLSGMPWIVLLNGAVFVAEGMSVLIQVTYFKATKGKRIFKMAPLHHHFEYMGWHETKVVRSFVLVGVVGALTGVFFTTGYVL